MALLAPLSCMLNPLDLDVNLKILMFSSADLLSSVRIKIHVRGTVLNRIAPCLASDGSVKSCTEAGHINVDEAGHINVNKLSAALPCTHAILLNVK